MSETPKVVLQPLGDAGMSCDGDVCAVPTAVGPVE
jgi:hypothetical protein